MSGVDLPLIDGLRRGERLARYTAARLGGPADFLYIAKDPDYSDTLDLLKLAWQRDIPVTVIGGGANVLVSDAGIRGLTIINRAVKIETEVTGDSRIVSASSGTNLIRLARFCQENGLSGLEWAIAVPGTVGGAVVNNAGAHESDIASSLVRARVYEAEGGERWYSREELAYDYRYSSLKYRSDRRFFVMGAQFQLCCADRETIKACMEHYNDYRRGTQPPGASLGSIFKNPPGDYAGRLIEAAGLKGQSIGAVQVSPIHANFFVNLGEDASASDYYRLICLVRERVEEAFSVRLELEIQTLGQWE